MRSIAQELQGRVAGRNSEDASQIKEGLIQLQAQWKSIEQSAKQVRRTRHGNDTSASTCVGQFRIPTQRHCRIAGLHAMEAEVDGHGCGQLPRPYQLSDVDVLLTGCEGADRERRGDSCDQRCALPGPH